MRDTTSIITSLRLGNLGREFADTLAIATWRHRQLHLVAFASLALAVVVGTYTGNLPDFYALREFGFYILAAFWAFGCGFAVIRLLWLALVERNPSPSKAILKSFVVFFGDRDLLINSLNGFVAIVAFVSAFAVFKGAIAILAPFSWDVALSDLDRWLHFGRLPHEWLGWLLYSHDAIYVLNVAYNFWFVILITFLFAGMLTREDSALRHQFLMSFMLIFLIAGFLIAMGFSSAGPCYYARLGLGGDYQQQMDALHAAAQFHEIWALSTQDMLWNGYTGVTQGSIGISAFPSIHVASSVLFALYASRRWPMVGVFMWGFAALIMVGSVVLAWHYAVDGYAGAAIALVIWKLVGRYYARGQGPLAQKSA